MPMHLFRCDHCEHKPRLGATTCGACGRPVTIFNWIGTHFILLIGIIFAALYLFIRA